MKPKYAYVPLEPHVKVITGWMAYEGKMVKPNIQTFGKLCQAHFEQTIFFRRIDLNKLRGK